MGRQTDEWTVALARSYRRGEPHHRRFGIGFWLIDERMQAELFTPPLIKVLKLRRFQPDIALLGDWYVRDWAFPLVASAAGLRVGYYKGLRVMWRLGLIEPEAMWPFSWRRHFRPFPWRGGKRYRA